MTGQSAQEERIFWEVEEKEKPLPLSLPGMIEKVKINVCFQAYHVLGIDLNEHI